MDKSSPVFLVDHSACILCERCVRACDEVMENNVIGRTGKGSALVGHGDSCDVAAAAARIESPRHEIEHSLRPLPVRPMTLFSITSSQARTHRSHKIQALWSTRKTGDDLSIGRRPVSGAASVAESIRHPA